MKTAAVKESFQVHNGEKVLKAGESKMFIVHRWFGMKSKNSKKPTWNEAIIASGPADWVIAQWNNTKANHGV